MITRRTLLQTTAAAGTAMSFVGVLPGIRAIAQPIPLRRSLQGMDLDDPVLETYREFVTMMKDPSRNGQPVSWVGFSDVHGYSCRSGSISARMATGTSCLGIGAISACTRSPPAP